MRNYNNADIDEDEITKYNQMRMANQRKHVDVVLIKQYTDMINANIKIHNLSPRCTEHMLVESPSLASVENSVYSFNKKTLWRMEAEEAMMIKKAKTRARRKVIE